MNQREEERGNRREYKTQSLVENINMAECTQEIGYFQSINSYKYLPQSPVTGHFALTSISLIFLRLGNSGRHGHKVH